MNLFGKKKTGKNGDEPQPAAQDPPKIKQSNATLPPPPEEIPQLDFRPKKAKGGDDGNQGTLGGFVGSIMGGGGGHQQDLEEGLLDQKASNNNNRKGGNKKQQIVENDDDGDDVRESDRYNGRDSEKKPDGGN